MAGRRSGTQRTGPTLPPETPGRPRSRYFRPSSITRRCNTTGMGNARPPLNVYGETFSGGPPAGWVSRGLALGPFGALPDRHLERELAVIQCRVRCDCSRMALLIRPRGCRHCRRIGRVPVLQQATSTRRTTRPNRPARRLVCSAAGRTGNARWPLHLGTKTREFYISLLTASRSGGAWPPLHTNFR